MLSPAEIDNTKLIDIVDNIDKLSNDFIEGAQGTLNKLISSKVELHKDKLLLEEGINSLRERINQCDSSILALTQQNSSIE